MTFKPSFCNSKQKILMDGFDLTTRMPAGVDNTIRYIEHAARTGHCFLVKNVESVEHKL
jgi:hypothetical protein